MKKTISILLACTALSTGYAHAGGVEAFCSSFGVIIYDDACQEPTDYTNEATTWAHSQGSTIHNPHASKTQFFKHNAKNINVDFGGTEWHTDMAAYIPPGNVNLPTLEQALDGVKVNSSQYNPYVNYNNYGKFIESDNGKYIYEQYGINYKTNHNKVHNAMVEKVGLLTDTVETAISHERDHYVKEVENTFSVTTQVTASTWEKEGFHWHLNELDDIKYQSVNGEQKYTHYVPVNAIDETIDFDIQKYSPNNIHEHTFGGYATVSVTYADGHQADIAGQYVEGYNSNYRQVEQWLHYTHIVRDDQLKEYHNFLENSDVFDSHLKTTEFQRTAWDNGGGTGVNVKFEGNLRDLQILRNYIPNAAYLTSDLPIDDALTSEHGIQRGYGKTSADPYHASIYSDYHLENDTEFYGSVHVDYFGNNVKHDKIIGVGSELWSDGAANGRLKIIAAATIVASINPQASGEANASILIGTSNAGELDLDAAIAYAWNN